MYPYSSNLDNSSYEYDISRDQIWNYTYSIRNKSSSIKFSRNLLTKSPQWLALNAWEKISCLVSCQVWYQQSVLLRGTFSYNSYLIRREVKSWAEADGISAAKQVWSVHQAGTLLSLVLDNPLDTRSHTSTSVLVSSQISRTQKLRKLSHHHWKSLNNPQRKYCLVLILNLWRNCYIFIRHSPLIRTAISFH